MFARYMNAYSLLLVNWPLPVCYREVFLLSPLTTTLVRNQPIVLRLTLQAGISSDTCSAHCHLVACLCVTPPDVSEQAVIVQDVSFKFI